MHTKQTSISYRREIKFVVLLFLAAWGNDTLAYCTGMLIGKHKMSPILSPKKSIEGLVGGIVGAAILGALYGLYLNTYIRFSFNPVTMLPIVCDEVEQFQLLEIWQHLRSREIQELRIMVH